MAVLAGSVTAPGAVAGWGAPVAVVAAVVALLVASGAVAAAAPVVTPEGTGIFSQVGLPPLGVSSVPGKNPPPLRVASSPLPIQSPISQRHCGEQGKPSVDRQRWPEGLCSLDLEAGLSPFTHHSTRELFLR